VNFGQDMRMEAAGPSDGAPDSGHGPAAVGGLAPTTAAAVSYLLWWPSGLLFLWLESRDRFVRFHAAQAVFTFGTLWALGLLLWLLSFAIVFLAPGLMAATAVAGLAVWGIGAALTIVAVAQAWRGRWWAVPLLGGWAAQRAARWFDRVSADPADDARLEEG
jgi:uncharacterized membrane protein